MENGQMIRSLPLVVLTLGSSQSEGEKGAVAKFSEPQAYSVTPANI